MGFGPYKGTALAAASVFAVLCLCSAQLSATEGRVAEHRDGGHASDRDVHAGVLKDLLRDEADFRIADELVAAQHLQDLVENSSGHMKRWRARPGSVHGRVHGFGFSGGKPDHGTKLATVAAVVVAATMLWLVGTMLRLCLVRAGATRADAGSRPRSLAASREGPEELCEALYQPVAQNEAVKVVLLPPPVVAAGHKARRYRLTGAALVVAAVAVVAALAVYFTRSTAPAVSGLPEAREGEQSLRFAPEVTGIPVASRNSSQEPAASSSPGQEPTASSGSSQKPAVPSTSKQKPEAPPSSTQPELPSSSTQKPSRSSAKPAVPSKPLPTSPKPRPAPKTSSPPPTPRKLRFPRTQVHCWQEACNIYLDGASIYSERVRQALYEGVTYFAYMSDEVLTEAENMGKDMRALLIQWGKQLDEIREPKYPATGAIHYADLDWEPPPPPRFPAKSVQCWQDACTLKLEYTPPFESSAVRAYLKGVTYFVDLHIDTYHRLIAEGKDPNKLALKWARQVDRKRQGTKDFPVNGGVTYTMDFDA